MYKDPAQRELIQRSMNILAKCTKVDAACDQINDSKYLLINCLFHYGNKEDLDLAKQCLICFH